MVTSDSNCRAVNNNSIKRMHLSAHTHTHTVFIISHYNTMYSAILITTIQLQLYTQEQNLTILPNFRDPKPSHSLHKKNDSVSLQYFLSGHSADAVIKSFSLGERREILE